MLCKYSIYSPIYPNPNPKIKSKKLDDIKPKLHYLSQISKQQPRQYSFYLCLQIKTTNIETCRLDDEEKRVAFFCVRPKRVGLMLDKRVIKAHETFPNKVR